MARLKSWRSIAALFILLGLLPICAAAQDGEPVDLGTESRISTLMLPMFDAERGRRLFVAKGCFICHSIGGVGGEAAPALDAPANASSLDPMAFVARMWRGARAMIELQNLELGYQIDLSGNEIADLAAFAGTAAAQSNFSLDEIPEPLREWLVDEPYWTEDQWPDRFQERSPDGLPFDYR